MFPAAVATFLFPAASVMVVPCPLVTVVFPAPSSAVNVLAFTELNSGFSVIPTIILPFPAPSDTYDVSRFCPL